MFTERGGAHHEGRPREGGPHEHQASIRSAHRHRWCGTCTGVVDIRRLGQRDRGDELPRLRRQRHRVPGRADAVRRPDHDRKWQHGAVPLGGLAEQVRHHHADRPVGRDDEGVPEGWPALSGLLTRHQRTGDALARQRRRQHPGVEPLDALLHGDPADDDHGVGHDHHRTGHDHHGTGHDHHRTGHDHDRVGHHDDGARDRDHHDDR